MKLRHLFSRQSRLALFATLPRRLISGAIIVAVIAVGWLLPELLPWWGWLALTATQFVGLALLGRRWADKDIPLPESTDGRAGVTETIRRRP